MPCSGGPSRGLPLISGNIDTGRVVHSAAPSLHRTARYPRLGKPVETEPGHHHHQLGLRWVEGEGPSWFWVSRAPSFDASVMLPIDTLWPPVPITDHPLPRDCSSVWTLVSELSRSRRRNIKSAVPGSRGSQGFRNVVRVCGRVSTCRPRDAQFRPQEDLVPCTGTRTGLDRLFLESARGLERRGDLRDADRCRAARRSAPQPGIPSGVVCLPAPSGPSSPVTVMKFADHMQRPSPGAGAVDLARELPGRTAAPGRPASARHHRR